MEGDTVVVRAYGGRPMVSKVWKIGESFVFICSEENYRVLRSGRKGLLPVGIPRGDVFRYNPSQEKLLKNWKRDPNLWEHLVNYV